MGKKKRIITTVDSDDLGVLAAHNEIRLDASGRAYGLGDFISRSVRNFWRRE